MLSHLKISYKILLMSIIQLLLVMILGSSSLTSMFKIGTEIEDIAHEIIPMSNQVTIIAEHQLEQAILFEKVLSHELIDVIKNNIGSAESAKLTKEFIERTKALHYELTDIEKMLETSLTKVHTQIGKEKYTDLLTDIKLIEEHFFKLEDETFLLLERVKKDGVTSTLDDVIHIEEANDEITHELTALLIKTQEFVIQAANQAEHDERVAIKVISIILVVAFFISITAPLLIGRSITSPIQRLIRNITEVVSGDGDLTNRIDNKSKDEVGQVSNIFDDFMTKLQTIIANVNVSAESLGTSSESALKVIQNTLVSVEKQRVETDQVKASVDNMSTATANVAKNTLDGSKVAQRVKERVLEGKAAAADSQVIINRLSQDVKNTAQDISMLVKETDNIGTVLDTIQGIAEQTNLLALNAAIEAARAGETGRGFAVVADEVRSLAQRTQSSTVDIQELVEKLQKEAANAMSSMKKGNASTAECLEKSEHTSQVFDEAVEAVSEISAFNDKIAAAAEEQKVVAEQVQKSIENIHAISHQTRDDAQQASESNEDIALRLIDLHTNLNQFKC